MSAPGYFGKVVTHGDFVGRRLPPDFVTGWDRWLQAGLAHSQRQLGARWRDAYMSSPVWYFALGAGVCGAKAVAGVMIPSVDRVGRYFPLTVGGSMASGGAELLPALFIDSAGWFDALMYLALASLAPGYSLEKMDAALAAMTPECAPQCAATLRDRAMFWTAGSVTMPPTVLVQETLPPVHGFSAMLTGPGFTPPHRA